MALAAGLLNQGATGYLNVALQALFHIPALRAAVLRWPFPPGDTPHRCPPLALQRVFQRMQKGIGSAVSTKELTSSFGWKASHLSAGQDAFPMLQLLLLMIQHTCRVLGQPDIVQQLFQGSLSQTLLHHTPPHAAAATGILGAASAAGRSGEVYAASRSNSSSTHLQQQQQKWSEPFLNLDLPLSSRSHQLLTSIEQCMQLLIKQEVFATGSPTSRQQGVHATPGRELVFRDSCLESLPPLLVLHLERSEWDDRVGGYAYLKHAVAFPEFLDLRHHCQAQQLLTGCRSGLPLQLQQRELNRRLYCSGSVYCLVAVITLMSLPGMLVRRYCAFVKAPAVAAAGGSSGSSSASMLHTQEKQRKKHRNRQQQEQQQRVPLWQQLEYSAGRGSYLRLFNEAVSLVPTEEALQQQYGLQDVAPGAAAVSCDVSDGSEADSVACVLLYVRMEDWQQVMGQQQLQPAEQQQGQQQHANGQQGAAAAAAAGPANTNNSNTAGQVNASGQLGGESSGSSSRSIAGEAIAASADSGLEAQMAGIQLGQQRHYLQEATATVAGPAAAAAAERHDSPAAELDLGGSTAGSVNVSSYYRPLYDPGFYSGQSEHVEVLLRYIMMLGLLGSTPPLQEYMDEYLDA